MSFRALPGHLQPDDTLEKLPVDAKYVNMTDINSQSLHIAPALASEGAAPTSDDAAPDARHVALVELLFFAYRDFTAEPDAILAELGFGRAHHRVLHFVNRNPGLRVADLLAILKITKQSLARVLKQLVDEDYICQTAGAVDRRERRLDLTPRGRQLADRLLALQAHRLGAALGAAGPDATRAAESFLFGVISAGERRHVAELVRKAGTSGPDSVEAE
jgi:DNA-binding MarR family transcriptional regulator